MLVLSTIWFSLLRHGLSRSGLWRRVDELMGLCDALEAAQKTRNTLRQSLRASALDALMTAPSDDELSTAWAFVRDNWDTMSDRPEDIEGLRQMIVHLAVKGKLGTQDINDDSAQTTFDSWKEYRDGLFKVQKDHGSEYSRMINKLSSIKEVEGFFVAPKKWIFAHLIELSILIVDCHNKTAPAVLEGIPLIRTSNIRDRKLNFKGMKYVDQETYEFWSRRCLPKPGDIIFTREAPMGEAAIIPEDMQVCLGQRTMLIRTVNNFVDKYFLLLALTDPDLIGRISHNAVGMTVKHLRVKDVEQIVLAIPPLAEQKRIVSKVEELMQLCDQLETHLRQQQTQAQAFAAAAVSALAA
jgi:type I restriction enzyme S subunit